MNTTSTEVPVNGEKPSRNLTTADLARSANSPVASTDQADRPVLSVTTDGVVQTSSEKALASLFTPSAAADFRSRWDDVQRGFVDDPQQAVRAGDELVAQVIKSLAETFSNQRDAIEREVNETDKSSTENLRLAFRRYRSFFERLLSI
jgi:hypothetical protein